MCSCKFIHDKFTVRVNAHLCVIANNHLSVSSIIGLIDEPPIRIDYSLSRLVNWIIN